MLPSKLHALLTAATTLKQGVRASRDCAVSDTPEPMAELFEWAEKHGDAVAVSMSASEAADAVTYYEEHPEHPVPDRWRAVFRRIYLRTCERRDRAELAGWRAREFTLTNVRMWMRQALRGRPEDYRDGDEIDRTRLAEECADAFEMADEGGPLDDEHHWIWNAAHEVATAWEDGE